MLKYKSIGLYVLCLFAFETLFQIAYYTISTKYLDPYNSIEKIQNIFIDALYVVGSIKVVFFLPIYFVFYLVISKKLQSNKAIRISVYHSILFLILFVIIGVLLPGNILKKGGDTLVLTIIAALASYILCNYRSQWLNVN